MSNSTSFRARFACVVMAGAVLLSAFGATPVRAQTPLTTAALQAAVQTPPAVQGPVRRLSIEEAVALALEQNLDLQVERINPQLQDFGISVASSSWTPNFFSNVSNRNAQSVPQDLLSGRQGQTNTSQTFSQNAGMQQNLRWGGNYSVAWANGRFTTNNELSPFNPQLSSTLSASISQPWIRNFKIDATRQQYMISKKSREMSDVQLVEAVAQTTRNVKNAYWDLVFANNALDVQRQSLALAQQSLRDNRSRVEIGTMAPIDIVEAQAEVARREESVILAEATISRAEDRLRALISNPSQPDFWNSRIEPTDVATFVPVAVDVDAAVRTALDRRTDLQLSRKQLESNDISIRYFRNQTLPDVSTQFDYRAVGIGGTNYSFGQGFPPPITGITQKSFGGALGDAFGAVYPDWTFFVRINYPIGRSSAEANLARARLQNQQAQKQLESQQLSIATQIRDLARNVQTNAKRVEATSAARALSEQRLAAEEKKFQAGMTTPFVVFQAQRDLNQSRNAELQARIDYLKSVVDFQTAQDAPIAGGGAAVTPIR